MAEALAAGLALDALKGVTKLVKARLLEEIKLARDFKNQLKNLENILSSVQAFLEDLGSARYATKSRFVNLWLQRFKDVVHSADEFMDDYDYELLRRKIKNPSIMKKFSNLASTSTNNPVVFRVGMSHRVSEILSKFDDLDKQAVKDGIQKAGLAMEAVASSSTAYYGYSDQVLHQNRKLAAARGHQFIGRKFEEERLLEEILNSSANQVHLLSTVAIVGIGGLGKTTLARKIYEHDIINDLFEKIKVWICVSEEFKVDRLLNEMFECLTSTKCDLTNTDAIIGKLQSQLKGKKLFLVLDDVWEENQESWNSFKNALLRIDDLRGCVILITTRISDVANNAGAFYKPTLAGLSENEGWALLQQTVFDDKFPYDSRFEGVGRRIVNKCKGVPLAIKSIGGMLPLKKLASEWKSIEDSEIWGFNIRDILPSLMLSYNNLNNVYMKKCFAYCAVFPKDFKMEKRQLITLWLAQGFLHDEFATNNSNLTIMESVGERYLNTLLGCSFFEEEIYHSKGNQIYYYKVHDLMHDLAAYVTDMELLVWKDGINLQNYDVSNVQHLSLDLSTNEAPPLEALTDIGITMTKLRTISFRGSTSVATLNDSTLGSAQYVRTLIMASTGLHEVPSTIGKLVHLRYLDLSHNEIVVLSKSICKLYQLQTLRIVGCSKLRELPRELHRLGRLRHIEADNFLLASAGLRQLSNLQTLPPLELSNNREGWSIDELGPLDQVEGEMRIRGLKHVRNKEAAIQARLRRKNKIVKLHLQWEATSQSLNSDDDDVFYRNDQVVHNDEAILDSLKPHMNLGTLYIDDFMGVRFPSWIMTLANLTEVKLIGCRKSNQLPTFGQLPALKILWLRKFDNLICIGDELYQSGSSSSSSSHTREEKVFFPSLRELKIDHCIRLATWMIPPPSTAAFPNLVTLYVRKCPSLEMVPVLHYKSLKHLKLYHIGGSQPLDIIKYNLDIMSLDVMGIENMVKIPQELPYCANLLRITIGECNNVEFIPGGLMSLKVLIISKCPSLGCISNDLPYLRDLSVNDCQVLVWMPQVTSLEMLRLTQCPLTTPYLQWIPNLHRLRQLCIGGFGHNWDFNSVTYPQSLRDLTLTDFPKLEYLPLHQQPIHHHQHLQTLAITKFDELGRLPEWIGNFSSLETLKLTDCNKLKYLPKSQPMQRLSRLRLIVITACPLLKQRYYDTQRRPQWLKYVNWT